MRIIDRLIKFLNYKKINPSIFERSCGIANGYLKKQQKGKGSIGSEILERIHKKYVDLSLVWLITGEGDMIGEENTLNLLQEDRQYYTKEEKIQFLSERIVLLENALADKEKIIALLESEIDKKKKS
jgi:hypothetical protein